MAELSDIGTGVNGDKMCTHNVAVMCADNLVVFFRDQCPGIELGVVHTILSPASKEALVASPLR